jgi:hypothetical protein
MSTFNISQLPQAVALTGSEQIPGDQFGLTVAITVAQLAALASIGAGGLSGQVLYNLNGIQAGSTSLTFTPGTGTLNATNVVANTVVATEAVTGSLTNGAYSYGAMQYADTGNLATFAITANAYAQIQLQNYSAGSAASADVVVANGATTAATGYGDFGINSAGFMGVGSLGAPNYVYLYSAGVELAIGTSTANGLHFVVNSGATDAGGISAAGVFTIASLAYTNVVSNTVPQNGEYLTTANTLAFASNMAQRATVGPAGNWVFNAPTTGTTASFTAATGGNPTVSIVGDLTNTYALQLTSTSGTPRSWGLATSGANNALYLQDITRGAQIFSVNSTGNIAVSAPSAGVAVTINGLSNQYAQDIIAGSTSGQSYGLYIGAGTTSADIALYVTNQANTTAFFHIYGDGGVTVGTPSSGGDKGVGTINAQGLYVNGVAVSTGGAPGGPSGALQYDNAGSFGGVSNWAWNSTSGTMAVAANTTGSALTLQGINSNYVEVVTGGSGTGVSYGLRINAGTNATDAALLVANQTGATSYFAVYGDGGINVGSPTGGDKGVGTLNAAGLYVNGVAVSTGGSPGGTSGLLQYNNGGSFGGATGWSWAASTLTVTSGELALTCAANTVGIALTGGTNTANHYVQTIQSGTAAGFSSGLYIGAGTNASDYALQIYNAVNSESLFSVNGNGNSVFGAPGSGSTVTINAQAGGQFLAASDGTNSLTMTFASGELNIGTANAATLALVTAGNVALSITSARNISTTAPTGGVSLTVHGVSGTHSAQIADAAAALFNAGFLEVPVNQQSSSYTAVLADSGKALCYSGGVASAYTIPANASVAYPIGATLTFINDCSAAANMTIAINSDTLVWTPSGSTGPRTLAQYGRAVAHKIGATRWYISGSGLT